MPPRHAPGRPFLIGVAGGTCSGKTTVSERLSELAGGGDLALIKLDSYYVRWEHLSLEQRALANYDHPDAFDWQLLNDHLAALAAGATVPVPIYDFAVSTAVTRCASSRRRGSWWSRESSCSTSRRCASASICACTSTPTPTCG